MFGKKLSEYVRFERVILILIAVAFISRLVVGMSGVEIAKARWVSINIVLLLGLIYCAVNVHLSGFGSYKQLLGLLFIQTGFAHILIACAILMAVVSGVDNIYTNPEFFNHQNGRNLIHVFMHVVAAIILPLIAWAIGSVILFVTRRIKPA
jgi:hypothetical protein